MAIAVLPDTEALTTAELRCLARAFDAISDETSARYPAEAFVDFVIAERRSAEADPDAGDRGD